MPIACSAILNSSFYAYSAILDSFVIVCFSVNLVFGINRASKINVGLGPGSGFKMKSVYNSGTYNYKILQLYYIYKN